MPALRLICCLDAVAAVLPASDPFARELTAIRFELPGDSRSEMRPPSRFVEVPEGVLGDDLVKSLRAGRLTRFGLSQSDIAGLLAHFVETVVALRHKLGEGQLSCTLCYRRVRPIHQR
jgi:hypothetical protein